LGRCRASVRAAIRGRLESIAVAAAKPSRRSKQAGPNEPPLRFYVYAYRLALHHRQQRRPIL